MDALKLVLPVVAGGLSAALALFLVRRYERSLGPECWEATHSGKRIRLENTWFDGARLYVEGDLVAENRQLYSVSSDEALLRARFSKDVDEPSHIEVYAKAPRVCRPSSRRAQRNGRVRAGRASAAGFSVAQSA